MQILSNIRKQSKVNNYSLECDEDDLQIIPNPVNHYSTFQNTFLPEIEQYQSLKQPPLEQQLSFNGQQSKQSINGQQALDISQSKQHIQIGYLQHKQSTLQDSTQHYQSNINQINNKPLAISQYNSLSQYNSQQQQQCNQYQSSHSQSSNIFSLYNQSENPTTNQQKLLKSPNFEQISDRSENSIRSVKKFNMQNNQQQPKTTMPTIQSVLTNSNNSYREQYNNMDEQDSYQSDQDAITIKYQTLQESCNELPFQSINNKSKQIQYLNKEIQVSQEINQQGSFENDSLNLRRSFSLNLKNSIKKIHENIIQNENSNYSSNQTNQTGRGANYKSFQEYISQKNNSQKYINNSFYKSSNENIPQTTLENKFPQYDSCHESRNEQQTIKNKNILINDSENKDYSSFQSIIQEKDKQNGIEQEPLSNLKTSQQNIVNFLIQNFDNIKNSLQMQYKDQNNNINQKNLLNEENSEQLKQCITAIESKPMFKQTELVQAETYLKLYEYKDYNTEYIVDHMFQKDQYLINYDQFSQNLIQIFPHLKILEEDRQESAIRFLFETIDLKQDFNLDANEVGLCFEIFYQYNSKFYNNVKKIDPKIQKVKSFFQQQLEDQNFLRFSQNLNIKIQKLLGQCVEEIDYEKKNFLTFWDIYSQKDNQNCQQLMELINQEVK